MLSPPLVSAIQAQVLSPSVHDTIGVLLLGVIVSAILLGVNFLQLYLYYTRYSSGDGPFLRGLVSVVCLLDSGHQALTVIAIYHYAITNFGNKTVLALNTWSLEVNHLICGAVASIVQLFYAWRILELSDFQPLIPFVILMLSLSHLGFEIGCTIETLRVRLLSTPSGLAPWIIGGLIASLACNMLISVAVVKSLQARPRLRRTWRSAAALVEYIVSAGLFTTLATSACIAAFLIRSTSLLNAPFYFVLCRLYAISMVSLLNNQDIMRRSFNDNSTVNTFSSIQFNFPTQPPIVSNEATNGHETWRSSKEGGLDKEFEFESYELEEELEDEYEARAQVITGHSRSMRSGGGSGGIVRHDSIHTASHQS